jgi:hypothetical protein
MRLIIAPELSRDIGAFGLDRLAIVSLFNRLRWELEEQADSHRSQRDQTHPDLYFWIELNVWDNGVLRRFRFTVDDARAPGHLFLVAAEEI